MNLSGVTLLTKDQKSEFVPKGGLRGLLFKNFFWDENDHFPATLIKFTCFRGRDNIRDY